MVEFKEIIKQDENRRLLYNAIRETEKVHPDFSEDWRWFLTNVKYLIANKNNFVHDSNNLAYMYRFITKNNGYRDRIASRYGYNFEMIIKDISDYVNFIVLNNETICSYLISCNYDYNVISKVRGIIDYYRDNLEFADRDSMNYAMFCYLMQYDLEISELVRMINGDSYVATSNRTSNNSNEALLSGVNFRDKRNSFVNDEVCMISDVGNNRNNQEDASMFAVHPLNNDFSIIAVADGLGGLDHGEIASDMALFELQQWFKKLDADLYYSSLNLPLELYKVINNINSKINRNHKAGYTTLSVAIVCLDSVVIANIGDSRIYNFKDRRLSQLTNDDSLVWELYKYGNISEEEVPFHKKSNIVTKCLGEDGNFNYSDMSIRVISLEDLDTLLLCTDGLSDLIPRRIMERIMNNNSDMHVMANNLVNYALVNDAKLDRVRSSEFRPVIKAGIDNTTCALCRVRKR